MSTGLPAKPVKITMDVLGARGYPLASVKLSEATIADFNDLIKLAQVHDPAARLDDIVRGIWRHGTKSFRRSLHLHKAAAFKYISDPKPDAPTGG